MRVMTFSRYFPGHHPQSGQPTNFVEKVWSSFWDSEFGLPEEFWPFISVYTESLNTTKEKLLSPTSAIAKHHTIRAGNRWKEGDWFSPRVWSGKPYRSKQIIIAPDIQVKKAWSIEINFRQTSPIVKINNRFSNYATDLARNDGLSLVDFVGWFPKPFSGQIICWNENINY